MTFWRIMVFVNLGLFAINVITGSPIGAIAAILGFFISFIMACTED